MLKPQFQSRHALALLVVTALATAMTSCSSPEKTSENSSQDVPASKTADSANAPHWSSKMQELSHALNQLLPLVADGKAFNDPKNEQPIQDATSRLKALSHQVKTLKKPSADPAFDSIASMLDEDLARAVVSLQTGNKDYARLTLRESIGYCIQCHTQTKSGPSFPKLELGFDPSKLSALGQGDYYAATRQFDAALDAYRKGVQDQSYADRDIFGWERAVRSGLAIAIRYKENPAEAKTFIQSILKNKSAPQSLKDSAKDWLASVEQWAKEPKLKSAADSRLTRAEGLIKGAEKRSGDSIRRSEDITYLRASADLHQWLSEGSKDPAQRSKALLYAGIAAEATRELNFWTLHERYYELCIQASPKTPTAQSCYGKLSDSVLLGYTGSSGLHLPEEEKVRLDRLKALAFGL
ncbi:MAG: hypothetical protein IPJ84_10955 [Bdellovibrionales bacterium]|nr:hypothetical protein [Bdellovibrionales bacterium]